MLRRALREHEIAAVVHFARNAFVGESIQYPRCYFQSNVVNSFQLLSAMIDIGVRYIVFTSTSQLTAIRNRFL